MSNMAVDGQKQFQAAYSLFKAAKYEEAEKELKSLIEEATEVAPKARMTLAQLYLDTKRHEEAEELLRRETERLLSKERKCEIAGIYLQLAEAAANPKEDTHGLDNKADFDKALQLYDFLMQMDLPRELRGKILIDMGRTALAAKNYGKAANEYLSYLSHFDPLYFLEVQGRLPGSSEIMAMGERVVEARLGVVKARLLEASALPDLKSMAEVCDYASSVDDFTIMLLDNLIAHLQKGSFEKQKTDTDEALREALYYRPLAAGLCLDFSPLDIGATSPTSARRAVTYAYDFVDKLPNRAETLELMRIVPNALYKAGFLKEAQEAWQRLLDGVHLELEDKVSKERLRRFQASAKNQIGEAHYGAANYEQALETWQDYLSEYPDGKDWGNAQEGIYRAMGAIGLRALTEQDYTQCREIWTKVASKRGLSDEAGWLHLAVAYSYLAEAKVNKEAKKLAKAEVLFKKGLDELGTVAQRYPGEIAQQARFRRAEIYRFELDELTNAVKEYALANNHQAQKAIAELTAVELILESPRVFRSNEEAYILFKGRNVDKLSIRRYAINLEDYYKKYHTSEKVNQLDLDLVSPDKTWQADITSFEKYRDIEHKLDVGIDKPGAYAVTVEGKDFEATVLVLKSDIEVIAATTAKEAIALVKNVLTDEPVLGAAINIWAGSSAGQSIQSITGKDGVARKEFSSTPNENPYVFARFGDHVAVVGGKKPSATKVSLQPKGFIYTSRPVFLPGETANCRGIIRVCPKGSYEVEEGQKYVVTLNSPSGSAIATEEVTLNRFGTFNADFELPQNCDLGSYQIVVQSKAKGVQPSYNCSFLVQYVQPAKMYVELTPSAYAALAGDKIELAIKAAYYTGAPLTNRGLSLSLPDGREVTLTTDEDGEATFSLDTTPYFRQETLGLQARLPGEDVSASLFISLLPAALKMEVNMPTRKYVVGERLDVPLTVKSPDDRALANEEIVVAAFVSRSAPKLGIPRDICTRAGLDLDKWDDVDEVKINEAILKSDENGRALFSLPLEQAGEIRLSFSAKDKAERELVVVRKMTIEEPASPELSVVVEKATLLIGDECQVGLHSKKATGLGLLLFTADSIQHYIVHTFRKGESKHSFTITAEHAPNLKLTALAICEKKLHRAEQPIEVRRKLSISVKTPDRPFAPGEEIEAIIEAKDGQGEPVATEFSLSMVDKGLLAKYADETPIITEFFEKGTKRKVDLSAFSSISFFRCGKKRPIAKEVLQEAARLKDAEKEERKSDDRKRRLRASTPKPPAKPKLKRLMKGGRGAPQMPMEGGGGALDALMCAGASSGITKAFQEIQASCDGFGRGDEPCPPPKEEAEREELAIGAFWLGQAETDENGQGRVSFNVPERTSNYRLMVHGVTVDTLVGQVEDEALVRKELYVDIKMPLHLLEGDELIPVFSVHNSGSFVGPVELEINLAAGLVTKSEKKEVQVTSAGVFTFTGTSIKVPLADELQVSIHAKAADKTVDRLVKKATIAPFGIDLTDGRAGSLSDSETFALNLSQDVRPETIKLTVDLSKSIDKELFALIDGPSFNLGIADAACRVYALARLCQLMSGRTQGSEERFALWQRQLQSAISALLASQNNNGSWPFIVARDRRSINGDLSATAWAVIALEGAMNAGLYIDTSAKDRAVNWLQENTSAYETLAEQEALLALTKSGAVDFSPLNRLNRNQNSLKAESQALLALSLQAFGKDGLAKPIAEALAKKEDLSIFAKALSLLLMEQTGDFNSKRKQLAAQLRLSLNSGSLGGVQRWLAITALTSISKTTGAKESKFKVIAFANGKELGSFNSTQSDSGHFELSSEDLKLPAKVELRYQGRGECAYRVLLKGFKSQFEEQRDLKLSLYRETYYHSPRLYKGRKLVDSQMKVTQLAADDFVEDKVDFINRQSGLAASPYMVLTRPIPAGLVVDESSIPSRVLLHRQDAGQLTMVFAGNPTGFRLRLLPFCPGTYRVMPSTLSPAGQLKVCDHLSKERHLQVLAPGVIDETTYDWTQREHVAFGKAHFNDGELKQALEHLGPLSKKERAKWQDVVKALLWIYSSKEFYEPQEVVDLFETVEQKYPSIVIPYDKLLAVGRAYHDTGENEAACLLWRSTMASSYRDDIPVAQELESAGEYLRSISYLRDLYWQYPSLPVVTESLYGLSQDVYAHKERAQEYGNDLSANDLIGRAVELLHEFLTFHGDEPYADEAFFSLLNAYRELGMNELCLEKAGEAVAAYAKSDYAGSYRYIRALAAFHLGKYKEAIEAARLVAESSSDDSNYATFILGQMYQAIGETDKSLQAYRKVENEFSDAQLSISFLERRFLKMPEVVTGVPGSAIAVEISYCNVTSVEVLAYRVDLMRLFLKEKNLDRIAGVKLAGITPTCTFEREVPPSPSGTTAVARIELPFEKVGAYLVLVRAKEAFASGLALITPLTMEVQELQGAARATVLEGKDRKAVSAVFTKCSDGYSFTSGKTDLRGAVTLAADSGERVTIVARRGKDEYAFFRSLETAVEDSKPCLDAFEEVSYDQGIRSANLMVQQRVASKLRSNFSRRSKKAMGLQASLVRK